MVEFVIMMIRFFFKKNKSMIMYVFYRCDIYCRLCDMEGI